MTLSDSATPTPATPTPAVAPPAVSTVAGGLVTRSLRWQPRPVTLRRLTLAALITNVLIVGTGGLVRLTQSGLGCPSWPDCAGTSLVPTRQLSWHKYVEFGNRMVTFVVLAAAVAALVGVLRYRPANRTLRLWAWTAPLGVVAQAIMGGVLVLTDLNPWWVSAHFVLSMVLVGASTVLWWQTREKAPAAGLPLHPLLMRLSWAVFALTYVVFCIGTFVTGSGPHAGDAQAPRNGLRASSISQLHADLVMLLVGAAVALAVAVTAGGAGAGVRRATRLLVGALALQAVIGYAQYFAKLPVGLVELHLLGAALIAAAATGVVLACREQTRRADLLR